MHLKNAILVACSSSSTTVRYNKCSSMAVTETATAPFSLSYFNKSAKAQLLHQNKGHTQKSSQIPSTSVKSNFLKNTVLS